MNIWGDKILLGVALLFSTISLLETFFSPKAWPHHKHLEAELEHLQEDNARILQNITEKRRALQAIRTRQEVQEHAIHSELGYVGEHDLVVNIK